MINEMKNSSPLQKKYKEKSSGEVIIVNEIEISNEVSHLTFVFITLYRHDPSFPTLNYVQAVYWFHG